MKTQIIQLEANDDFISVRDKMTWGQTRRILLLWPERGRVLNRRLDLILLQRQCNARGAQLALVSNDPEVHFQAGQLGIPVFDNRQQAQSERWRGSRRRQQRPRRKGPTRSYPDMISLREQARSQPAAAWLEHPISRLALFAASILALLAMAAVLLPGAQITLSPARQVQVITLPISAGEDIQVMNLAGELPAHPVSVIVEGRESITSTGTVQAPLKAAIGGIRFTNLTDRAITIPQGTVVTTLGTNPIRFATTRSGEIPAGPGRSMILPSTALTPGTVGNLPANSLQAIDGALGLSLAATNPSPTHSGSDSAVPAPSPTDRTNVYNQLLTTLSQTARRELPASLSPGDFAIMPTLELAGTLEETYDIPEGQPGERLQLTLRLEFQALVVSAEDLQEFVTPILDANLPEAFTAVPQTLEIRALDEPTLDEKGTSHRRARWRIQAEREIQAQIALDRAINLVSGLPMAQAVQRLSESLPLEGAPKIAPIPPWWPRLPFLPFRIQVIIADST